MLADEFVCRMASLALTDDQMDKAGVPKESFEVFRRSYQMLSKGLGDAVLSKDPIVDLIRRYDVVSFEVASFRLKPDLLETSRGVCVGVLDGDLIVIDRDTLNLCLYSECANADPANVVAKDSSSFLDAIYELAASTWPQPGVGDNDGFNEDTTRRCAALAGVAWEKSVFASMFM